MPKFMCESCGQKFTTKFNLQRHQKKSCKPLICDRCQRSDFSDWQQFKSHAEVCNKVCPYCGKTLSRMDNTKRHMDKCKGNVEQCLICGQSFPTLAARERHQKKSCKPLICDHCQRSDFLDRQEFKSHVEVCYKICPYCKKQFSRTDKAKCHMDKCKGNVEQCLICGQSFPTLAARESHIKNVHKQGRPYACEYCGEQFDNSNSLCIHKNTVHRRELSSATPSNDKETQCSKCGQQFSHASILQEHFARCGQQQKLSASYRCEHCGNEYDQLSSLSVHNKRAHRSPSPPRAQQQTDIPGPSQAVDTHTGDGGGRPCRICHERFSDVSELRAHVRSQHHVPPAPPTDEKECERLHQFQEKSRPHQCPHCDVSFVRKSTLKEHILKRHSAVSPPPPHYPPSASPLEEEEQESDNDDERSTFPQDPSKLYKVVGQPQYKYNEKFRTEQREMTFTFSNKAVKLAEEGFSYEVMEMVLRHMLAYYMEQKGFLQVFIYSDTLEFCIKSVMGQPSEQLIHSIMYIIIHSITTWKGFSAFMFDAPVTLKITFVPDPQWRLQAGWRLPYSQCPDNEEYCRRSYSCWEPIARRSNDYNCVGACLVAFRFMQIPGYQTKRWFQKNGGNKRFQEAVNKLYREAGVDRTTMQKRDDFVKFQKYLNTKWKYQMIVYDTPRIRGGVVFTGHPSRPENKKIYLAVHKEHCFLIIDIQGYLEADVCVSCFEFYHKKTTHTCRNRCSDCEKAFCIVQNKRYKENNASVFCQRCYRSFQSAWCFAGHELTVCPWWRRCTVCDMVVEREQKYSPVLVDHDCYNNQYYPCKNCKQYFLKDGDPHYCAIQRPELRQLKPPTLHYNICYDFETYMEKDDDSGTSELKPYLVACSISCEQCSDQAGGYCKICGKKERYWWGRNEWERFCEFLFYDPRRRRGVKVYAWAHNAKRFDHTFILQYLINNKHHPQMLRFSGTQIIHLKYNNVEFKDFFSFFPQKLAAAPKAFGFEKEAMKGYFSHFFPEAKDIDDPPILDGLPDEACYGVERMKNEKEVATFRQWYSEHKNDVFDFKAESIAYCQNDVYVLGKALQKYREMSLKISGGLVDGPMSSATSLAGFSALLQRCLMPENSVGLIPRIGYTTPRKQSAFAMMVMDQMNREKAAQNKPLIQHREHYFMIQGQRVYVDGYIPEEKIAIEVHGCFCHACPKCYASETDAKGRFGAERIHPFHKRTYKSVLERTRTKECLLKSHPSVQQLIVKWECEVMKDELKLTTRSMFEEFWRDRAQTSPYDCVFDLRDALYGGVCEVFCLSRQLSEQEILRGHKILFYDIVSMYPYVQYAKEWFRKLHPGIYDAKELQKYGRNWDRETLRRYSPCIASCLLMPPDAELYPNIPCKINGHTMFVCCWQCATENRQGECPHDDVKQRGILGTYTSEDLEYALELGYQIVQIFQLHSWWSRKGTRNDIFRPFMGRLIKVKVENSGWPEHCNTQEQKEEFVKVWREHGIEIEPENIEDNPAMKTTSKLLLNSNWGKMAERARNRHIKYVNEWAEFKSILFDRSHEVDEFILTPDGGTALVTYSTFQEDCPDTPFLNIAYAAFVTSYARTKLFKIIHQVPGRAMYCDTDSIIFEHPLRNGLDARMPTPIGDTWRDLKSELPPGALIIRFQALGPKNYRFEYKLPDGTTYVVMKAKGIQQTSAVKNSLDGNIYQALIEKRLDALDDFYQRYESADPAVSSEAARLCRQMGEMQRKLAGDGVLKHPPGLYVADPKLQRWWNDDTAALALRQLNGTKIIKMTATKRVFLPNDLYPSELGSIPFGFKWNAPMAQEDADRMAEMDIVPVSAKRRQNTRTNQAVPIKRLR